MVSYLPKKYIDHSNVHPHHNNKIDDITEDQQKHEMLTFYNLTKPGIDV